MSRDLELSRTADRRYRPLQRAIGEGGEPAALLADEVVMVLIGVDPLVARCVAADLYPLHEMQLLELVEGAVDARPPNRLEPPVDLQRGEGAGLGREQLDHLAPRGAAAVAGLIEAANCCPGPIHSLDGIRE